MTRRKRLVFAIAACALSLAAGGAVLLAADLYLHSRAERSAGLNIWGYRGPLAGRKAEGERRIAFLGGSTMFGYGVTWDQAIPALVEQRLDRPGRPISAVNLGYNNEGAYSFRYTLEDFRSLAYDIAVLYEGYNDLMGDPQAPNTSVFRHESAVFRLVGYYPLLPLVLREKALLVRGGGDLEAAYASLRDGPGQTKTVFRPDAGAMEAAATVMDALGRQLGQLREAAPREVAQTAAGCPYPWTEYCSSIYVAIQYALSQGTRVVVASQPRLREPFGTRYDWQQEAVRAMIARHFDDRPDVHYVDLRAAVDLADPALCYDAMHLTAAGNAQVAAALAAELEPLLVQ